MKYLFFIVVVFLTLACKKKETKSTETCSDGLHNQNEVNVDCGGVCGPCEIEYPEFGAHGANVLFGTDTVYLTEEDYSMKAIVPEGSSLKLELTLISGVNWYYGSPQNWTASQYVAGQQSFEVLNPGAADLRFHDNDTSNVDVIRLRYFENSSTWTKEKIIVGH